MSTITTKPDVSRSQLPADDSKQRTPGSPQTARKRRIGISLSAHGEPMVWLTSGSLMICLLMIVALLAYLLFMGLITFWPSSVAMYRTLDGQVHMGEVARAETYDLTYRQLAAMPEQVIQSVIGSTTVPADVNLDDIVRPDAHRILVRTGNFDLTSTHFHWVDDVALSEAPSLPKWAIVAERIEWGRLYGFPQAFILDGQTIATDPEQVWALYNEHHTAARQRFARRQKLERDDVGDINFQLNHARLAMRSAELSHSMDSQAYRDARQQYEQVEADTQQAFARIRKEIDALEAENHRYQIVFATAQQHYGTVASQSKTLTLDQIVRAYPANQLSLSDKVGLYLSRWWEFLSAEPREANSEGGVWPAIFGTVMMTFIMTLAVVPFGVLGALYLREYAKTGVTISAVRIAINNLAGVPSIVYGVFGLGFFCYIFGAGVDQLFFAENLPNPTFGKGAIIWASLTLALLTLPVVIVATEEALAAVPNSMREGSYACGASKWQTIRRIVLPRAMPGIMTGAILAISRGAGEVAPLMLVGAVKLAPELPFSWHPGEMFGINRSFMHLGFHVYDLGFQSQNSEAAKPMVFTTTLLLIAIVFVLNISAIWLRTRLRAKFAGSAF